MKLLSYGEVVWDICGDERSLGGAPLNLAAHVAQQGGEAWLLSAVGSDPLGKEALCRIEQMGVHTEYIYVTGQMASGKCIVTLDGNGIPAYELAEHSAYDQIPVPQELLEPFHVLAFGTLALRTKHSRCALRKLLAQTSFRDVYTDLNIRPPFYSKESISMCLSHATILKMSDEEIPLLTKEFYGEDVGEIRVVERIARQYPQIRLILVTQGAKGAFCYDCQKGEYVHCAADPVKVVSTVGAGDSFGATFLTWYGRTGDIMFSLQLAVKVSAFVVSRKEAIPTDTKAFLENIALPPWT